MPPADVPVRSTALLAAALLRLAGPGPLLPAGAPWRRRLPDGELSLYPLPETFAAAHPSGDSVFRTPPPGPRLVVSRLDGSGAREVLNLNNPGFPANPVAASPDGEWIAYMRGSLFAADVRGDLRIPDLGRPPGAPYPRQMGGRLPYLGPGRSRRRAVNGSKRSA